MPKENLNEILRVTHRGATIESVLPDGYLIRTPDGSMSRIKNAEMSKLTQRYMHQAQHVESPNTKSAREYLASNPDAAREYQEGVQGYQHGRGEGNPFIHKDGNQSSHRNPFYNPPQGLPSERADAPQRHQVNVSPSKEYQPQGLPSDRK